MNHFRKCLVVGLNLSGRNQEFVFDCSDSHEIDVRTQRLEALYKDNCDVNGTEVWSPLALSFAKAVAMGDDPVRYTPDPLVFDSDCPSAEYVEMFQVESNRFPSLRFKPADMELFSLGHKVVRERLRAALEDVTSTLKMDGLLSNADLLTLSSDNHPQQESFSSKPLVDEETMSVYFQGKSAKITSQMQFRLLERLARKPGRFVQYQTLADEVWMNEEVANKTIQNTLWELKQKLKRAGLHTITFESIVGAQRLVLKSCE